MKPNHLIIINILALIGVLTTNALANILPINGMNTGEVSALFPSLFTPAGFTFGVWSVIYLLLIGFSVYQFMIKEKGYFAELSLWFLLSCAANICWILAWHYLYIWASVIIMITLLYSLIKIFLLLQKETLAWMENVLIKLPFLFYFSWICVATIANISALLISLGWNGSFLSGTDWTVLMTTIATLLGIYISAKFKEPAYLIVLAWALFGIFSKHVHSDFAVIASGAIIELVIIGIAFFYLVFKSLKTKIN